jgi:hypothetical protein
MAISHKHPWEFKQEAKIVENPTKEEFDDLNARAIRNNEKEVIRSPYTMIDGIPHKFCAKRGWVSLTKMD